MPQKNAEEDAKFAKIKNAVLGRRYDLSVAFLPPGEMRSITRRTLRKDRASNVLAFPFSKNSGEVLLCRKARAPFTTEYLFIHALLHLKGHKHGVIMEREENRLLKKFGFQAISHEQHRYRNRRRDISR